MVTPPGVLAASVLGRCPRCGQGKLFDGYLAVAPECSVCGQNFREFDVGDGAASLVILVVGAIVCGLALWVEFTFQPPLWLHALIWTPVVVLLTFVFLRLVKAALLVLQYRHKAGEGRVE